MKISKTVTQFNDYLWYWDLTTPFGSLTAKIGTSTKEMAEDELRSLIGHLMPFGESLLDKLKKKMDSIPEMSPAQLFGIESEDNLMDRLKLAYSEQEKRMIFEDLFSYGIAISDMNGNRCDPMHPKYVHLVSQHLAANMQEWRITIHDKFNGLKRNERAYLAPQGVVIGFKKITFGPVDHLFKFKPDYPDQIGTL